MTHEYRSENYYRSDAAHNTLLAYESYSFREQNRRDLGGLAVNLLTDIQHMLEEYNDEFDELVRLAKEQYEKEKA